jgi:hypothetical protein
MDQDFLIAVQLNGSKIDAMYIHTLHYNSYYYVLVTE